MHPRCPFWCPYACLWQVAAAVILVSLSTPYLEQVEVVVTMLSELLLQPLDQKSDLLCPRHRDQRLHFLDLFH